MKYDRIRKNPSRLQSLTGFSVEEFDSFLPIFKYEWDEYCSHYTLRGKVGERISCGRGSGLLPMIGDKLLFILSCLKNNDAVMLISCGLHNFRISFKESLINSYCT
jgi:hypothetical protein